MLARWVTSGIRWDGPWTARWPLEIDREGLKAIARSGISMAEALGNIERWQRSRKETGGDDSLH